MNVVTTEPVDIAVRILDADKRRRVQSWFETLENWENDPHTRSKSKLIEEPDVYALSTSDGTWVFFCKTADTITLLDIASQETIDRSRPRA